MVRKRTDVVQLSKIRISEELRRKLVRDAEKNNRTLNGEIVHRLEESYLRVDFAELSRIAAREALRMVEERIRESEDPANQPTTSFYDALVPGRGVKGVKGPKK